MNTEETLMKTWEFMGHEILPLSYARKMHLSKLVDFSRIAPWDIAVLVFALICDEKTIIKGLRDVEHFDTKVSEWLEKSKITMEHFNEGVLGMIKEIMEHSDSNKAAPISDPSMMPDPVGNL